MLGRLHYEARMVLGRLHYEARRLCAKMCRVTMVSMLWCPLYVILVVKFTMIIVLKTVMWLNAGMSTVPYRNQSVA